MNQAPYKILSGLEAVREKPSLPAGQDELHRMVFEVIEDSIRSLLSVAAYKSLGLEITDTNGKKPERVNFCHSIYTFQFVLPKPCISNTNNYSLNWTQLLKVTRKLARVPPFSKYIASKSSCTSH